MAKKKTEEFTYSIEEFIAPLKESSKHDFVKGVMRVKWGDNPVTLDIRNVNLSNMNAYKGISLSDEEADTLVNILLDEGYGSIEEIEKACKKRKSMFDYKTVDEMKDILDDDMTYIEIDLDGE